MTQFQAPTDEAYGPCAAALLGEIHAAFELAKVENIVEEFYRQMSSVPAARTVLDRLTPAEIQNLHKRQTQHLRLLAEPGLGFEEHRRIANHIGHVHAMLAIDIGWLIAAYGLYQRATHAFLQGCVADPLRRSDIMRVLARRMQLDLEGQVSGYRRLDTQLASSFAHIHEQTHASGSLTHLYETVLGTLTSIEGVVGACAGRMDSHGALAIEISAGDGVAAYFDAMDHGVIPPIPLRAEDAALGRPAALAWHTGKVQSVDALFLNPALEAWGATATRLGIRALVAVPLVDDLGETFGMICAYSSWPGFFGAPERQAFWQQLQRGVTMAAQKHAQGHVIPYDQRKLYSRRVRAGQVRMLYQPVIDLKTRQLVSAEALARLVDDDGGLIPPGVFLPALGNDDLLHLFDHGMRQICAFQRDAAARGRDLTIAVNMPPQAVHDRRYHDVLFTTLESSGVDTERLQLEVLETPDQDANAPRNEFFATIRALGIAVVQDDLGAGHSSLLRMSSMPFDAIKIDQGLVLQLVRGDPARALEFIYHLTRLAHGLGVGVTAEGVEHEGLIEAVAVLGVDKGQGFAIARPMEAAALLDWRGKPPRHDPTYLPATALGALAVQLLWDQRLQALSGWPALVEAFVLAPCAVGRYATAVGSGDVELAACLADNRATALGGAADPLYRQSKAALTECLTRRWRAELGASAEAAPAEDSTPAVAPA
jgi:EAL domain-containing protein (putative c-di-GMP-specific phosphodiesterase class I)